MDKGFENPKEGISYFVMYFIIILYYIYYIYR